MHVGACVLQKLRKLGGRGQNFGFYTKIAQKGLLSTHRGGKWCPNGVLMTSTCSGHGYYKMASKLGPKSKPFWKYLGLTACLYKLEVPRKFWTTTRKPLIGGILRVKVPQESIKTLCRHLSPLLFDLVAFLCLCDTFCVTNRILNFGWFWARKIWTQGPIWPNLVAIDRSHGVLSHKTV